MPINLSVQKLQEPCYNSRNLKTLLLSDLNYKKKWGPNSLTSQGKLSWLCVRCAQPRTTKYQRKMNFLAEEFFKFKLLTVFNEGAIFQWKQKALLKIRNEKSAALKTKLLTKTWWRTLYCQASPRLAKTNQTSEKFLPNSETTERKLGVS